MSEQNLEQVLQRVGKPTEYLRGWGWGEFTKIDNEYTHWCEEQRAWRESVAFMDLSYHMADLEVSGPDAVELFSWCSVNDYTDFDVGKAKQLVVANPNGEFIGDGIVFRLDDEKFLSVGPAAGLNWVAYQADSGDYDVEAELRGRPVSTSTDPKYYRYQVQGPHALDVVEKSVGEELPEIGFFNFEELYIGGNAVNALRHGMAGEPGFELFGPYEDGEEVKSTLLEAGGEYGIRRVGSNAYTSVVVESGWVSLPVPAIYDSEEMKPYREWLSAKQGTLSIGGSFDSDDITDYYVTPVELDYGRFIDFDHDFIGKEALQEEIENPEREKVTLVWDEDDAVSVYASLFSEGDTNKHIDLPVPRWAACQYDEVSKDGEHVGVTQWTSYSSNEREMLSLAVIDTEYADPGTEVTIRWGEAKPETNPQVEQHDLTDVSATVAPAPYVEDRR
jgi:glycine cleavage system aminomethyltransferase T